jgi:hypothetical protein
MRIRPKRFRATVITNGTTARPITLTAGPGLQFDLELDETRDLILALYDAYERVQQRGVGGC